MNRRIAMKRRIAAAGVAVAAALAGTPVGGIPGQGVTVAVLDTGIDNLPDFSGRLAGGVDLTGGNNPFQDGYGHGTFVAGLIAGNGGLVERAVLGRSAWRQAGVGQGGGGGRHDPPGDPDFGAAVGV